METFNATKFTIKNDDFLSKSGKEHLYMQTWWWGMERVEKRVRNAPSWTANPLSVDTPTLKVNRDSLVFISIRDQSIGTQCVRWHSWWWTLGSVFARGGS